MHIGRSWTGTHIEDECPCPKTVCGLVSSGSTDPHCGHHPFSAAKTIRQAHPAQHCPGTDG
jgi:hypothetical protein